MALSKQGDSKYLRPLVFETEEEYSKTPVIERAKADHITVAGVVVKDRKLAFLPLNQAA